MDHMNNTLIPERLKSAREQLNLSKVLHIKRKRNMIFHTSQSFECIFRSNGKLIPLETV